MTKSDQITTNRLEKGSGFRLHNFYYIIFQTPPVNYVILKVRLTFDLFRSAYRPPEMAPICLIPDLVSILFNSFSSLRKMQYMHGKFKDQLVSCLNLVQIEWERTHLKEDNWANIPRCQLFHNYVIDYVIVIKLCEKKLILDLLFMCDVLQHKIVGYVIKICLSIYIFTSSWFLLTLTAATVVSHSDYLNIQTIIADNKATHPPLHISFLHTKLYTFHSCRYYGDIASSLTRTRTCHACDGPLPQVFS